VLAQPAGHRGRAENGGVWAEPAHAGGGAGGLPRRGASGAATRSAGGGRGRRHEGADTDPPETGGGDPPRAAAPAPRPRPGAPAAARPGVPDRSVRTAVSSCWCGGALGEPVAPRYRRCVACGSAVLAERPTAEHFRVVDDERDFYGRTYWTEYAEARSFPDIC